MKPMSIFLNNKQVTLNNLQTNIFVNNQLKIKDNDEITITHSNSPTINDLLTQEQLSYWNTAKVTFNNESITLKEKQLVLTRNDVELSQNTELVCEDKIILNHKKNEPFIFQDIFRYVDLDLSKIKGTFKLLVNNSPATFYKEIKTGDLLEIKWD